MHCSCCSPFKLSKNEKLVRLPQFNPCKLFWSLVCPKALRGLQECNKIFTFSLNHYTEDLAEYATEKTLAKSHCGIFKTSNCQAAQQASILRSVGYCMCKTRVFAVSTCCTGGGGPQSNFFWTKQVLKKWPLHLFGKFCGEGDHFGIWILLFCSDIMVLWCCVWGMCFMGWKEYDNW